MQTLTSWVSIWYSSTEETCVWHYTWFCYFRIYWCTSKALCVSPFSRRYYNSPYITTVTYAKIRDDILPSHTPNSKLVRRSCGLWLQSPSRWNHWRSSTLPLLPRSPQYPRLPAQPCFTPRLSLSYWGISLNNCPLPPWDESSLAGEEGEVERVWGGRGGGKVRPLTTHVPWATNNNLPGGTKR